MKKRELGRSGLMVGDIGLGCMGFVIDGGTIAAIRTGQYKLGR